MYFWGILFGLPRSRLCLLRYSRMKSTTVARQNRIGMMLYLFFSPKQIRKSYSKKLPTASYDFANLYLKLYLRDMTGCSVLPSLMPHP
jgi:hypothetical protein